MNKKCLIKFGHGENIDLMHYVIFEGEVVVLSKQESKKVDFIKENKKLHVSFDIESKEFDLLDAVIVFDEEYVKKVYNYMIETNNAYFKDGYEGLCVIKLNK